MENKITRETKEILMKILLGKAKRIAEDVLEKAGREKQKELTVDEKVDLIDDIVFVTTVLLAGLGVSVEDLEGYKY